MPNLDNGRQPAFDACVSTQTEGLDKEQTAYMDPETDLITLTLGGNDMGFADIIRYGGWFSGDCEAALKNSEESIKNSKY
jgi:lysophospholipase L1-like esterase